MDALPPDPYAALGVAKDATLGEIKGAYRKLVLRYHPDKVQDVALKQAASDKFHKVQTAWEIVGDEDRRQRYDAQCKLADLRRDMAREGGMSRGHAEPRSSTYRAPAESARAYSYFDQPHYSGRMSPQYEERRPSQADYFDAPRPASRKDDSHDRSSRRTTPRDSHKKSRTSDRKPKETERSSREERSRRAEQDVRRERDKKFAYVSVEEEVSSDSPAEDYERRRSESDARKVQAQMNDARRRQEEEATAHFLGYERTQKYYSQDFDARAYIASRGAPPPEPFKEPFVSERRPSPVRKSSSRDTVETIRREGKPTINIRRGSGRPAPSTRDSTRKASSREKDVEIVDEPEETFRKPSLSKAESSPENIRPPLERQRSNSVEDQYRRAPRASTRPSAKPSMKRAETMPYPATTNIDYRKESSKHSEARRTYPSPETTPEPTFSRKPSYGHAHVDDDDEDTVIPEIYPAAGYSTVYREPKPRMTRSPSPMRESREKTRTAPSRPVPPPANRRTTSTYHSYPTAPAEPPSIGRENSGRDESPLFGEIRATRSPRPTSSRKFTPPADEIRYSPKPKAEDVRMASGYKTRRPSEKPHASARNGHPISAR